MSDERASPRAVFARLIRNLEPYLGDIVLTGGWVHAIYLADANRGILRPRDWPIYTDDIDFTVPPVLLSGDRPQLIDLVIASGFEAHDMGWMGEGELELIHQAGALTVDLDFLTRADRTDESIPIEGQRQLIAHGYPDLHILTEQTQWIEVGKEIHESLDPSVRIKVPTPAAYVLQKGLASQRRTGPKMAKDVVGPSDVTHVRRDELTVVRNVRSALESTTGITRTDSADCLRRRLLPPVPAVLLDQPHRRLWPSVKALRARLELMARRPVRIVERSICHHDLHRCIDGGDAAASFPQKSAITRVDVPIVRFVSVDMGDREISAAVVGEQDVIARGKKATGLVIEEHAFELPVAAPRDQMESVAGVVTAVGVGHAVRRVEHRAGIGEDRRAILPGNAKRVVHTRHAGGS
jgi:hypothetical protein